MIDELMKSPSNSTTTCPELVEGSAGPPSIKLEETFCEVVND